MKKVEKIAVIGTGPMAYRIALEGLMAGYTVVLNDVGHGPSGTVAVTLRESIERRTGKGQITPEESRDMLARLIPVAQLRKAVAGVHLAIEVIWDDPALKKKLFVYLDRYAPPDAILATSASTMSVSAIGEATMRARNVVGMHFFNPPAMKLVEVVHGRKTSPEAVATAYAVAIKMGKVPVIVRKDSPGFIFNRINAPAGLLLQLILEEGRPRPQDFDAALRPFMPMTPFEFVDYMGTDTMLQEQGYYASTLSPDYRPRAALRELVAKGYLGRKTGRGIYDWSSGRPVSDSATPTTEYSVNDIIALQVNEATKLLEEEVVDNAGVIDLAYSSGVAGAGPFTLARGIGYPTLLQRCEALARKFGIEAFMPTETMRGMHVDITA